jgi:type VI secretion system protein ImpM
VTSPFTTESTAVLGKSPVSAEYLRVNAGDPSLRALDGWLTDASDFALNAGRERWPPAFASGPPQAFVYRSEERRFVVGVLAPSADRAGRQFPLVVATPLTVDAGLLREPALTPLVFEHLWAENAARVEQIAAGTMLDVSAPTPEHLVPQDIDLERAQSLYGAWSGELPLSELWALLGISPAEGGAALRLLRAAVAPFRGVECPTTPLTLRVPLGRVGGVGLCFWIDVLRRSVAWRATIPSYFWSHDGEAGSALLHLGVPPRTTLAQLFIPSTTHDELCDLTAPLSPALLATLPELPSPLVHAVLSSPNAPVAELLAGLVQP